MTEAPSRSSPGAALGIVAWDTDIHRLHDLRDARPGRLLDRVDAGGSSDDDSVHRGRRRRGWEIHAGGSADEVWLIATGAQGE